MRPIRVLVVGMTATVGGIENFLMTYCGHIDRSRVQFDFLTRFADAAYPEQRDAIGRTYVIPKRSEDPVGFYREIRRFFREHGGEYDVLWDNECMFNDMTPLQLAAEAGIPVRIAHSHNPQNMDVSLRGRGQEILHRTQRAGLSRWANVLWACSRKSAEWACPEMDLACTIIPNAIDAARFRHDRCVRQQVRDRYDLADCLVVGHVGRLQYQKNQGFLLQAFARLRQREPRARLMIVGDGPDLADLEARAVELGVSQDVLFLGVRDDVPDLMQAFDVFVMPSRFEGLGMAALEAQAAGLPCVLSDAVPREAAQTADVAFLPAEDADIWAEKILDVLDLQEHRIRPDNVQLITDAGYDIATAADRLAGRFEQLVGRSRAFRRRFIMTVPVSEKGLPAMSKARLDVQRFAAEAGYAPAKVAAEATAGGNRWRQLCLGVKVFRDWFRLFVKLNWEDLLLVQYPVFPVKAGWLIRFMLHMVQWKGARTAAIVHDLDSLRLLGGDAARWSDQEILPAFDRLIVHTPAMRDYLAAQGIPAQKMAVLGQFDYFTPALMPERRLSMEVCYAGNLRKDKAGWLYAMPRTKLKWHLWGTGWKGRKSRQDLIHHGQAAPEVLPARLEGSFGVVWDGSSISTGRGAYGAYMMLNAPHKLSLYLAAGMPVVVWSRSAEADWVLSAGVGLAVESLADLPRVISALTPQAYEAMVQAARREGMALRNGQRLLAALEQLERD
ncbi:MAG: glycosyltransferase [Clostridia bacterium]|nr:glycosyltransferase [Clostridia bacterium]